MENQPKPRLSYSEKGEIIVHFPDGTHDQTNLVPSDEERAVFEAFFETTAGLSYVMQKHDRATVDGLTKLLRQQPARGSIEQMFERLSTVRFDGVISVIMLDLDHFGMINKQYGNPGGDLVLRWFADILKKCIRLGDVLSRWGGEEFLIVAPASKPNAEQAQRQRDQPWSDTRVQTGTTIPISEQLLGNGKMIAERIRLAMQNNPCMIGNVRLAQTVTIGVANAYIKPESSIEGLFDELLQLSNQAMYRGKIADKRNQVHIAPMVYGRPKKL